MSCVLADDMDIGLRTNSLMTFGNQKTRIDLDDGGSLSDPSPDWKRIYRSAFRGIEGIITLTGTEILPTKDELRTRKYSENIKQRDNLYVGNNPTGRVRMS
jgi:hypothetical protein